MGQTKQSVDNSKTFNLSKDEANQLLETLSMVQNLLFNTTKIEFHRYLHDPVKCKCPKGSIFTWAGKRGEHKSVPHILLSMKIIKSKLDPDQTHNIMDVTGEYDQKRSQLDELGP